MLVTGLFVEKNQKIQALEISYIRCMRWTIILFLLVSFSASAQKEVKLRRKFYGKYKGTVPSYEINTGNELIEAGETPLYIVIRKSGVSVKVGERELIGTYVVLFKADDYYLFDCNMAGQMANERILVYKRGKKLSRNGMFPQAVSMLKKYKK